MFSHFCKVVFVVAYVEEKKAGNLDSLVDACQVLSKKNSPYFSSAPFLGSYLNSQSVQFLLCCSIPQKDESSLPCTVLPSSLHSLFQASLIESLHPRSWQIRLYRFCHLVFIFIIFGVFTILSFITDSSLPFFR